MPGESWRTLDRVALSKAYNNFEAVDDAQAHLDRWARLGDDVRAAHPETLDLVYGPRPRNRIDLLACGRADAPLLVFIHGGYWQRNAKEPFACMATGPLGRGLDVALVGYTLAPAARLGDIVAEVRAALDFLRERHHGRLVVSGWSAGGHLAALTLDQADAGLAISAIYDLAPIRATDLNDRLGLSDAQARDLSPINALPEVSVPETSVPLTIAYGTQELPELRRQSSAYHAARRAAGLPSTFLPIFEANHFSILDGLIDPAGPLTEAVVGLATGV